MNDNITFPLSSICNVFFYSVFDNNILKYINKKNFYHIKAVNEGAAVSACIGNFLATKKIGCVYMQNSGLSNAINPLISIA